jgi:dTDP-4-amino-4,6-dideoxygalactose transaminase
MILTGDPDMADRLSMLRQYGWKNRYVSEIKGVNSRLDDLQAAVLQVKLRHLDEWNLRRQSLSRLYDELLEGCDLELPVVPECAVHVFHQYVIRSKRRDQLRAFLAERSIRTAIHYPVPVHLQPAFKDLGYGKGDFPNTEQLSEGILSLPLYPELTEDSVEMVCEVIKDFQRIRQ